MEKSLLYPNTEGPSKITVVFETCRYCKWYENDLGSPFEHRCSHLGGKVVIGGTDQTPDWCPVRKR